MHKWFTRHRSVVSSFLLLLLNSSESVSRRGEKWDARSGGNSPLRGSISLGTSVMKVFANRYQSMKFFLWLSIGHRLADTNRYQLTNFIDWYRFIDCISGHRFHWLVTPGNNDTWSVYNGLMKIEVDICLLRSGLFHFRMGWGMGRGEKKVRGARFFIFCFSPSSAFFSPFLRWRSLCRGDREELDLGQHSILVPRGRDPSGLRQESRSRFLAQTRRIAASGDENGQHSWISWNWAWSTELYGNPYLGLTLTFEINSNSEIRELKGNFGQYCAFYILPKW